jgi:hypothetical protein
VPLKHHWSPPLLDDEASMFICQAFQCADAFLFGRRTYEICSGQASQQWTLR